MPWEENSYIHSLELNIVYKFTHCMKCSMSLTVEVRIDRKMTHGVIQ